MRLYHCPQTRSTRILWLLEELGIRDQVEIEWVTIARQDPPVSASPTNPHPEGKVPVLQHNETLIMESGAIVLYLTELFPDAGLGRSINDPQRGEYLNWLHYYGGVIEPVLTVQFSTMKADDMFHRSFRGPKEMSDRLTTTLSNQDYLLGDRFSAADLLISAPFIWFEAMMPDTQQVRDWVARCAARPGFEKTSRDDLEALER